MLLQHTGGKTHSKSSSVVAGYAVAAASWFCVLAVFIGLQLQQQLLAEDGRQPEVASSSVVMG
jgi:hypothetical protein